MAARIGVAFHAPVATRARIKKPVTALRLWWKGAVKQVAKPCRFPPRWMRKRKSGGQGNASLPWHLPMPMSADAQMWADYRIFKAAGLLSEWVELYRARLSPMPEPEP